MALMLPKVDVAFKLLFGDERSKNILKREFIGDKLSNSKFSQAIQNLPCGNDKNRYAVVEALAAVPVAHSMPDAAPQPPEWLLSMRFFGKR